LDRGEEGNLSRVASALGRFACTECGKCCDRSPEVELSEAAALADLFVFRLMFRNHRWPSALRDYTDGANASDVFYQTKRLLGAHAARKSRTKVLRGGSAVEYDQYLFISALSFDDGSGTCGALSEGRCSIYSRRPYTCRTVPFQYWHVEASLPRSFDAFLTTPGYECDTRESAPVVLDGGRIVDEEVRQARTAALAMSERDKRWREAILRRLKSGEDGLPTLREIEANASFAATTVSMGLAWQIAVDAGIMRVEEYSLLVAAQADLIERKLKARQYSAEARQTLLEMQAEYRRGLGELKRAVG
jgi:Fe-S-cluster containining protein